MKHTLWPNEMELPIIGLTGKKGKGKTMFGLTIARTDRTIHFDLEKSATSYKGMGFTHVDLPEVMQVMAPGGYTQRDMYLVWKSKIEAIEPDRFDVIMVDPISDIESGMVDEVKSHYAQYGYSSAESFGHMKGVFWGYVAAEWKSLLLKISTRCQSFVFTTHMRVVYKNGEPTDKMEPKGKGVLLELASMYLEMEKEKGQPPSAIVKSCRLMNYVMVDGVVEQVIPLLPDRIPVATPRAVREYILNPPTPGAPKEGEIVKERALSETEKLELQSEIAKDERIAAEKKATLIEHEERLQKSRMEAAREIAARQKETEERKEARPSTTNKGDATDKEIEGLVRYAEQKGVKEKVQVAISANLVNGLLSRTAYNRFVAGIDDV